jgi:hypothetical protein
MWDLFSCFRVEEDLLQVSCDSDESLSTLRAASNGWTENDSNNCPGNVLAELCVVGTLDGTIFHCRGRVDARYNRNPATGRLDRVDGAKCSSGMGWGYASLASCSPRSGQ